jgi:hypothetical protein
MQKNNVTQPAIRKPTYLLSRKPCHTFPDINPNPEKEMKKYMLILAVLSNAAIADTYVNPYFRNDGTYVQGHVRSDADSSTYNNYSSQGNANPYTGNRGYESNASNYDSGSGYGSPDGSFESQTRSSYGGYRRGF